MKKVASEWPQYGYRLVDDTPDRPELTDEQRIAMRRADEITGDALNKLLHVDDGGREELIARHGFPKSIGCRHSGWVHVRREFIWSCAAVQAWKAEILELAAKLQ